MPRVTRGRALEEAVGLAAAAVSNTPLLRLVAVRDPHLSATYFSLLPICPPRQAVICPTVVRRARAVSSESTVLGHVTASARFADASASHSHSLPLSPLKFPSRCMSSPDADVSRTPTVAGQRHKSAPLNTCHSTSRATPC
jgi:hypothetical protein